MRCTTRLVPVVSFFLAFLASGSSAQGVRVNGPLAPVPGLAAEDVLGFQISPDGSWVAFFADAELEDNRFELFSAPIDASASSRRLNGPLVDGGNLATVYEDPDMLYVEPPHLAISVTNRVVYRGDQDVDEVQELYSAPIDGSAPPVKLSGTMVAGGDVSPTFLVSPDGTRVLFLADRVTDGVIELFSAPIDASSAPVRLNAPLPSAGFTDPYPFPAAITPDSLTVVYRVEQTAPNVHDLWTVPIDGSTGPVRLNSILAGGGDVADFRVSPDGTQVVYRADQAVNDLFELWRVPTDASASPVRVNGTLDASIALNWSISLDGTRAVYYAVEQGDSLARHYSSTLAGPQQSVQLYDRTDPALYVAEAVITPDGSRVVLWGDYLVNEVYEVFVVPIDGSVAPLKLNADLVAGGDVGNNSIGYSFRIAPDASRIAYWADQVTVDVMELWSVPIDRVSEPVRISGELVPGGGVASPFLFSPDGLRVVYLANQRGVGSELWSTPSAGGAAPVRLSGKLVPGGNVVREDAAVLNSGYDVSSDGARVVYRADQTSNELFGLWTVPIDRSRRPRELNAALDPGPVLGDVMGFAWTPDSQRLVYAADQALDEHFEVHAAELAPRSIVEPVPNVALGTGIDLVVSPDSNVAAFQAEPTCDNPPFCARFAPLYGAFVDGSQPPLRCNPSLQGYAVGFQFTSDSAHLVFMQVANGYHFATRGIFSFAGGAEAVSLTEPAGMVANDDVYFYRFAVSPDGARVVYLTASLDYSLWSVPVDRSLAPVRIADAAGPLVVHDGYQIGPDSQWVFFVADLDTEEIFELYRVPIDGSSPPQRLGPPLPAHADVDPAFRVHPDGNTVLFVADYAPDEAYELWSVPADPAQGTVATRLSAQAIPGGGIARGETRPQFEISAPANRVVYLSDERVPDQFELFSASLDAGTPPVRLSVPRAEGADVFPSGFRLDPVGGYVVYAAPNAAGLLRLFTAPIDGSGTAIALGGPWAPGGELWSSRFAGVSHSFELTPDGATVVYLAEQIVDETFELLAVPTDGSLPARRVNRKLVAGGDVFLPGIRPPQAAFAISPDGSRVAYVADQHTDEVFELFISALEFERIRPAARPRDVVEVRR